MKTSGHPQPQDMDEWMQGTETGYSADALASETDEQDQNELTTGQELNSETVIQMPDSYVIKWCSREVLVTIGSLLFLTLSYCVDMSNLIMYLYKQKIALFCSYLLCTALPAIFIHCFITKRQVFHSNAYRPCTHTHIHIQILYMCVCACVCIYLYI